jgi:N utilization substance protein A
MVGSAEILGAIRELTNTKQLDRTELHGLLQDGIHAALAKKHGPNVQAEVEINEASGKIKIVLLKTVVEEVTDASREISVDEARFEDPEFQPGDIMELRRVRAQRRSGREAAHHSARSRRGAHAHSGRVLNARG